MDGYYLPKNFVPMRKNSMIYIGLDDTDNAESRGTGNLARQIAADLSQDYPVIGVVRHQLLLDPRVPYTKNNSSAAILLDAASDLKELAGRVRLHILADLQQGSDPGLCLAAQVPQEVIDFGRRTQREVISQEEARRLARSHCIVLLGLGGDEQGVVGALAAVGLAASGEDGRYIAIGKVRDLNGICSPADLLTAGVASVRTREGTSLEKGQILVEKLRPARRGGLPVAFVNWSEDHWEPLKLD